MSEEKKVICPWCGAEMELEIYENNEYSNAYGYVCGECTATAPAGLTEEEALEKAMRYFKPLKKPLTLEDFKQSMHTPVWFESHGTYKGHKGWWMIPQRIQDKSNIVYYVDELSESNSFLGLSAYGSVWRCWATKPTDEERKEAKWET